MLKLEQKIRTLPEYVKTEMRQFVTDRTGLCTSTYYNMVKARLIRDALFLEQVKEFLRQKYNCMTSIDELRSGNAKFFLVAPDKIELK